jgi:hypothetical protein
MTAMTADEHHPQAQAQGQAQAQAHAHWIGTGHEIRARIEHALHVRSATPGTTGAKLEQVVKDTGSRVWIQLKKRPSIGVVVVGATGLAVASVVGVGEIAIAMIAGYAAYQVLREGVSPGEAAKKIMEQIAKLG